MTVVETLLVYVGAPLAVVVLLAVLTYLPGGRAKKPRYKPGQPWNHPPVWYEPHPEHTPAAGHGAGHGETQAIGSSVYGEPKAIGSGSSGSASGASAAGSSAPAPVAAGGPRGGARGTW